MYSINSLAAGFGCQGTKYPRGGDAWRAIYQERRVPARHYGTACLVGLTQSLANRREIPIACSAHSFIVAEAGENGTLRSCLRSPNSLTVVRR